jgi:hypothetical protein
MDSGKQLDGSQQKPRKVTLTVTEDDQVSCMCGCTDWLQPVYVFKVQSQLIGTKPVVTVQPCTQFPLVCAMCRLPLAPEGIKTVGERKQIQADGNKVVASETEIKNAARSLALRMVHTVVRQAEILEISPEKFSEFIDQEQQLLQEESQPSLIGVPQ